MNGVPYNSLSGAGSAITERTCDGWGTWRIKVPGSMEFVLAKEWRKSEADKAFLKGKKP
jgi:hypothetical protein